MPALLLIAVTAEGFPVASTIVTSAEEGVARVREVFDGVPEVHAVIVDNGEAVIGVLTREEVFDLAGL